MHRSTIKIIVLILICGSYVAVGVAEEGQAKKQPTPSEERGWQTPPDMFDDLSMEEREVISPEVEVISRRTKFGRGGIRDEVLYNIPHSI